MKKYAFSLLLAPVALFALSFSHPTATRLTAFHPTATRYYASIKGSKQGQFKTLTNSPGGQESQGWMEIFNFSFGASNPATIGQASNSGKAGKVTLQGFTITKKTDGFSSLLHASFVSNEILENIIIQTRDDKNNVTQTTVIKNATIKEIKKNGDNEILSLLFEQIERK
jgi:type VI protein secretion system component Hcp